MLFKLQREARSLSDNRPSGARKLGVLNGTRSVRDALSATDTVDYYSFKLTGRSAFNLSLTKLQNNVNVFLLKAGKTIARGTKPGKQPEAIASTLDSGTYYVRVERKSGNSRYRLTLNASSSSSPGSRRFLAYNSILSSGIVTLNNSTGELTKFVDETDSDLTNNFHEIAAFGNELFVAKGTTFIFPGVGSGLHKINLTTGVSSFVGDTGLPWPVDALEFTPTGALYGIRNRVNGVIPALYSFDTATGKATLVAELPTGDSGRVGDMVYDPASGRFLVTQGVDLYSVGLAGDFRKVGLIGSQNPVEGLMFDNGVLYGFTNLGDRFIINPTTAATSAASPLFTASGTVVSGLLSGAS